MKTTIGIIAAFCTTLSFLPQVIQVLKTKHTKDLSLMMYLVFVTWVFLWLVYGIMVRDIPIIVANTVTLILASIILLMKIRYK
jgi:MtN3 and saliva related transmembrane protein